MPKLQYNGRRMGSEKRAEPTNQGSSKAVPGPGTYATKTTLGEGPKVGIQSRPTPPKKTGNVPGPGAYEPNLRAVLEKAPAVGLGAGNRGASLNKSVVVVPGPGAYSTAMPKPAGPKYGFGTSKRAAQKPNPFPGPGNYPIPSDIGNLPPHEKSKCLSK